MIVSEFKREDVPRMVLWGKHSDERFFHYNFDIVTNKGFDLWFKFKSKSLFKRIYKVEVDNLLVGFITVKQINYILRCAELGLVFDPNHLSKGYGSKALKIVVKKCFEELKLKRVYLRVADFNVRAKKAYQKAGFKPYKYTYEPFEYQRINDIIYRKYDGFDLVEGTLYTNYTYMEIKLTL